MTHRPALAAAAAVALLAPATADAHTLRYNTAKKAAQTRADQLAGQRTTVNTMMRMNRHTYYAQAKWTRVIPDGCKGCEYDPETGEFHDSATTEHCWVSLAVRYRSHRATRPTVTVRDRVCT